MAKTLTEQTRLWAPTSEDPRVVGDGGPMHSAIPFDAIRWLNNLQTYCEPTFQFACDITGQPGAGDGVYRILHQPEFIGAANEGFCMLGQLPILVPVQATRLCWSFGFYRGPASGEVSISCNVPELTMYLSPGPCTWLHDPHGSNPAPQERSRVFLPSFISGPYTSNTVVVNETSSSATEVYRVAQSETWTDFAPLGLDNVNDRNGTPWAYLIVTAEFDSLLPGEVIRGGELSVWGQYE